MTPACNICDLSSASRPKIIRRGFYYRTSDGKHIQRYRCPQCKRTFSQATGKPCFGQKKRQKNEMLRKLLCSGVSQRRAARILSLSRNTVVRKFVFLSGESKEKWASDNRAKPKARTIEFDELITLEHTKCKPLAVALVVEFPSRRILGLKVSSIPANGPLARLSRQKYGLRRDRSRSGRREALSEAKAWTVDDALIKSDENPHYLSDVRHVFPKAQHQRFPGKRGAVTGQGELKKVGFDPIFSLNHTCAMLRANISRLIRRTWCTTKRADRLEAHLFLYANYHNEHLERKNGSSLVKKTRLENTG